MAYREFGYGGNGMEIAGPHSERPPRERGELEEKKRKPKRPKGDPEGTGGEEGSRFRRDSVSNWLFNTAMSRPGNLRTRRNKSYTSIDRGIYVLEGTNRIHLRGRFGSIFTRCLRTCIMSIRTIQEGYNIFASVCM